MESHGSVRVRQDVHVAVAAEELMSISVSDLCIVVVLCGQTHCTPLAQGCPRTNREVHSSYGQVFGKAHRTQDACQVFRCSCASRWVHLACASWECRTRPADGYISLAPAVDAAPAHVASCVAPVPDASATQMFLSLASVFRCTHLDLQGHQESKSATRGRVLGHETPAIRGREVRHTSCSCCRCQAGVHVAQVKTGGACRL